MRVRTFLKYIIGLFFESIFMKAIENMARIIICATLLTGIIVFNFSLMTHGIDQFLDKTMAVLILSFALVYSLSFPRKVAFNKMFGNGAMKAGWLFGLMSLIVTTNSPFFAELHMKEIGMSLSGAFLYVLYGLFVKTIASLFD